MNKKIIQIQAVNTEFYEGLYALTGEGNVYYGKFESEDAFVWEFKIPEIDEDKLQKIRIVN